MSQKIKLDLWSWSKPCKNIKLSREFIKSNKDSLMTRALIENSTLILNKEYNLLKINEILTDNSTYEKIDSNPLKNLKKYLNY